MLFVVILWSRLRFRGLFPASTILGAEPHLGVFSRHLCTVGDRSAAQCALTEVIAREIAVPEA